MTKLILIRHGETKKNAGNRLHTSDDPESLNEKGREQMETTSLKVSYYSPSKIYYSKEKRAMESARIIAKHLNISPEEIDGMQERNWGIFGDKPWEEVNKVLKTMTLEERYNYVPEGGESWKTFEDRLTDAIKRVLTKNFGKVIVIVTHGGAIRALMPFLLGLSREESFKYDPDNASLTVFEHDGSFFKKVAVNDTSHLKNS